MKIKLGVFFGGKSVEHEVSIITAIQAMDNIDKDKYEITYSSYDKYSFQESKLGTLSAPLYDPELPGFGKPLP